ncbi:MutS protein msh4, partial [Coelomomyces lativittatus]
MLNNVARPTFSDTLGLQASRHPMKEKLNTYVPNDTFILQNIRNDSLVLMDELGRGTSCRDALGIAFAIIEFLARTKAFVLFATHFHLLTNALQIYPNVVNLHFNIQYNGREMKFLHKIEDGECKQHGYGLDLASSMDFPESVLKHAQRISRTLHLQKPTPLSKESVKARLYHEIAHRLKSIVTHSQLKAEALTSYLTRFQQEGRELIKELEEKEAESSSHSPNMTNDNGVKSPSSFNLSQLNSLTNAFNELQENYEDNHLMLPSESNLENDPETTEPKNEPYPSLLFLTTPTNSSPFITVLPSNGQNKMNSLPTPDSHIITAVNTNKHDSIYLDVAKYLGSSPNSVSTEETVSSCTDVTREVRSVTPDNASTLYVLMKSKKREIDKVEEDNMIEE